MKNGIDEQYIELLKDILENGVKKADRTETGTISVFGRQIRHKMSEGFPLITTKKMAFKTMVKELLWFLSGQTNIKYLVDNNCHIWDGDDYQAYLKECNEDKWMKEVVLDLSFPNKSYALFSQEEFINKIKTDDEFADKWGDLGKVYGYQWRNFNGNVDQIKNAIHLLKTDPDSRRIVVTAWNPSDLEDQVLPPCHYFFQFYTRELSLEERMNLIKDNDDNKMIMAYCENPSDKWLEDQVNEILTHRNIPTRAISLMWNQRSCDFPLGIPANIMSYALLLMMFAKQVNMVPEELIGNFGDCHIYLNQIDGVKEQVTREPYPLPIVKLSDKVVNDLSEYTYQDIILENYQSHPKIYFPLSN